MVSEFERKRLENIERNRKALREFQLKEAANLAFGDKQRGKTVGTTKLGTSPKRRRYLLDNPTPPRRVRNLRRHGITEKDRKNYLESDSPAPPPPPEPERRKEGELKFQDFIEKGDWAQALSVIQGLDANDSQGDFFKQHLVINDEKLAETRSKLGELQADERDIKVVPERVTSLVFHPTTSKKIVLVGDKMGELGIWDASMPEDEGLLNFKFHTHALATIHVDGDNTTRVYTGSYDGSVRVLDMQVQKSTEAFVCPEEVGISDFTIVDRGNILYYTTLDGHFGTRDLRAPHKESHEQLCEKKIGGFSVNPDDINEIATASLDRSMKLWDIRKSDEPVLRGIYDSRLSVSATSWNTSGQIVCNGYDNTINVFNMNDIQYDYKDKDQVLLEPSIRLSHNCQTGRWVSILKARWQEWPHDGVQKFVIGNMKRFADVFAGTGQQLAHLDADHLTAVPAVSQFHPTQNWIAGGNASGKVYMWTPQLY